MIQLDFFEEPPTEIDCLKAEIEDLKERQDKQRRSFFSRLNQLTKILSEIQQDYSRIERLLK